MQLDANIEDADVDDDAAIQALMEGTAQGTAPSKEGHVVIAIENPNPDLDIKILEWGRVGVCSC